ncbi:MAG TPA: VOC family protein [Thermoanaerobaculia bacterium]|nr:VOC family protein [Thermoanaerobaculia bacterium]
MPDPGPAFTARLASLEIPADDTAALARFYADAFGWSAGPVARSGDWRRLSAASAGAGAGAEAAIASREALGVEQPVAVIEIAGTPLAAVLDRVVAAGGTVERPPRPVGRSAFALFRDPAGNLFGLWQL